MRFAIAALCFSLMGMATTSYAAPKTLLFCKNIDQEDLKDIVIREVSAAKSMGTLEIQESMADGDSTTRAMPLKDLKDGYISLSKNDEAERTLVRKDGGWAVLENAGNYRSYYHAECVE